MTRLGISLVTSAAITLLGFVCALPSGGNALSGALLFLGLHGAHVLWPGGREHRDNVPDWAILALALNLVLLTLALWGILSGIAALRRRNAKSA